MSYLGFEVLPKSLTRETDIGRGQIKIHHLSPELFLELQLVKLHTHSGSSSRLLESEATPEMVKAYRPREREEHGVATWEGAADDAGSVVLTFGTPFSEVPDVMITPQVGSGNINVATGTPTRTGVTIYWNDLTAGTHTSVPLCWLAKGR